uniref:Distal membrane-arm assembly complex protein 1-like domain-containing protein n=1 Tax=Saimiri boliviensis boliviensis TaxID=39432 RepID=A0A2K6V370_SAIBB
MAKTTRLEAEIHDTGSETSQPLQSFKIDEPPDTAAVPAKPAPAKPAPPATPGAPNSPAESRLFNNCWSCRLLSGLGLLGAGGYMYLVARSIATWGIVIMADPKGKAYRIA